MNKPQDQDPESIPEDPTEATADSSLEDDQEPDPESTSPSQDKEESEKENSEPETEEAAGVSNVNSVDGTGNIVAGFIAEQNQFNIGIGEKIAREFLHRGPAKLEEGHFLTVTREQLASITSATVARPDEVTGLVEFFRRRRILLLEGPVALGKGTLALKVASRLCKDVEPHQVKRLHITLTRHLSIDLGGLVKKSRELRGSILILEGTFQHRNEDLIRFAQATDEIALGSFESQLVEANSFLILTYDSDQCPNLHPALKGCVKSAIGPTHEQLHRYFAQSARQMVDSQPDRSQKLTESLDLLLQDHTATVVTQLATIPRIENFVHEHLLLVLEDDEVSLESALQRADRLDRWLLEEQSKDLATLTYILAMAICHAGPTGWPVRWMHFERLRLELLSYLRHELNRDEEEREPSDLCREPELMQRLRIEVTPGHDGAGDIVRFVDENRADRLWSTLLGAGRSLCALLEPKLIELATSKKFYLRQHACWSLGRISRIDPHGLFGRLFHRWSRDLRNGEVLGSLIFGTLVSQDHALGQLCRQQIRSALEETNFRTLESCTLALGELGSVDLALAIEEMRRVVKRCLKPRLEKLHKWEMGRRRKETQIREFFRDSNLLSAISSLHDRQLEGELYSSMPTLFRPGKESRLLGACQYTLIGLCFEMGSNSVLHQLMRWMPIGKEAELGPMLSLFFLRRAGVLEVLSRYPVRLEAEEGRKGKAEEWSRVLASAASTEGGVELLADFLFALYLGTCEFPRAFARALFYRWLGLLERWTRQAAKGQTFRQQTIQLWCLLLKTPDRELRDRLLDLLDHPELGGSDVTIGNLVQEIHRQREAQRHARRLSAGTQGRIAP